MITATEWMEGYVSDVPYTANFYYYQVPDFLNLCILLKGYEPPNIKNGFNYLELGSGMGFNLNFIAALYPEGNFWGIDFNPEHIAFSNKIKNACGLKNVSFCEMSFEEMLNEALDDFPMFDYITLHGILAWVSHKNRLNLVEIIKKKLKPGGVCFASYNDMCGWWKHIPFQRLLLDYSKLFPDIGSIAQISVGMNLIKQLRKLNPNYFDTPFMRKIAKKVESGNKNYLAHEYLNQDWKPLFFTEVLSYMSHTKAKYITQADPIWDLPKLFLNQDQLNFLQQQRSELLKEILKDYLVNMSFRKDIYVKGGSKIPLKLWEEKLLDIKVVLRVVPTDRQYKIELPYVNKNANIAPKTIDGLIEVLSDKNMSIRELLENNLLEFNQLNEIIPVLVLLLHSKIIDLVLNYTEHNKETSVSLNKVVAMEARYSDLISFFCIPSCRSGVRVDLIGRLVYDALLNLGIKDIEHILSHVKKYLEDRLVKEIKEEEISQRVTNYIENTIPQWVRLGILDKNILD